MIVVSDTSPISALIKIGKVDLLSQLFGQIIIPPAVETELLRAFHDHKGRMLAEGQGLRAIGLVGAVVLAKSRALIPSARIVLTQLQTEAHIYISQHVLDIALQSVGE